LAREGSALAHQFVEIEQQREATSLGMWVFLATEIMFFGGLFTAYIVYRTMFTTAFIHSSNHLDILLGTVNTAVLITSSLTMALAVFGSQAGSRKMTVAFLALTILLGAVFLGIKFYEYYEKIIEHLVPGHGFVFEAEFYRPAQIFFSLYFIMTGLHALHMIIGIGVLATIAFLAWRGRFSATYYSPVELAGLYWHFVDIIWIFLYPLLYLLGRHQG
jgi:cytochrome c oxidase subunit III